LHLEAQTYVPPLPPAAPEKLPSTNPDQVVRPPRPNAPDDEHVRIESVTQEVEGPLRHLRGNVRIETSDMQLRADEVDFNSETGDAEARGHVRFEHFVRNEKLECEKAEYNVNTETGKFYEVTGSANPRIQARKGLLTTQNRF
jgi:LPS-assembly protein